jgi:hypothetical protein
VTFVDRLKKCAQRAGLSCRDLSIWFDMPYATMWSWLHSTRVPSDHYADSMERKLAQLEQHVKAQIGFPLGRERLHYIRKIRDGRRSRVPAEDTA